MPSLKERIEELMQIKQWSVAQVARAAGVSSSSVSQWLGKGSKEIKSIALEPALKLEQETALSALWLSKGEGPKFLAHPVEQATPRHGDVSAPPRDAEHRLVSDSDWQILCDLRDLPADEQTTLISDLHARAERYRAYGRELLAKIRSPSPVGIERRRDRRGQSDVFLGGLSAFGDLDERVEEVLRKTAEEEHMSPAPAKKRTGS